MSLINIRFRHIRSFRAVAQEKSFARAASILGVSQPALSQTISQFEEVIGFRVFTRTTRHVDLTVSGRNLLEKAADLGKAMDDFHVDVIELRKSVTNTIRLGYLIGTGVELLPDLIREFERQRPSASIELVEFDFNTPDAGLAAALVDCAIIRPPIDTEGVSIVELAREPCVVCLPSGHRLARSSAVTIRQLMGEEFVAAPIPGVWRDYWLGGDHWEGKPPKVSFEAATVDSELQAVATGKGISITAESTAKFYARPGVEFKPILDMPTCAIAIGFKNKSRPLIHDLIAIAKTVAARHNDHSQGMSDSYKTPGL